MYGIKYMTNESRMKVRPDGPDQSATAAWRSKVTEKMWPQEIERATARCLSSKKYGEVDCLKTKSYGQVAQTSLSCVSLWYGRVTRVKYRTESSVKGALIWTPTIRWWNLYGENFLEKVIQNLPWSFGRVTEGKTASFYLIKNKIETIKRVSKAKLFICESNAMSSRQFQSLFWHHIYHRDPLLAPPKNRDPWLPLLNRDRS